MPRMFDKLKSLPLTIVLTILIWMYAEAQNAATKDELPITVHVTPIADDQALRMVEPADGNFHISIEGTQARVDRFANARPDELGSLDFSPAQHLPLGSVVIDAAAAINSLPYFKENGLTVTSAIPARIKLDVDQVAQLRRPILFRGNTPVKASPALADIMMPKGLRDSVGEGRINVYAMPLRELDTLPAGVEQTIPAKLVVDYPGPTDDRVVVSPQQVTLTLTLPKQREQSLVIPDVPVYVSGPPDVLAKYTAEVRPRAVQITVAGAERVLDPLRPRTTPLVRAADGPQVRAYLDLTSDDKPSDTFTQRALRYVCPPGLDLRQSLDRVEFRLIANAPTTNSAKD